MADRSRHRADGRGIFATGADGLCCSTLYELPVRVGSIDAGDLLWAASFSQQSPPMSIRAWLSRDGGLSWAFLSTIVKETADTPRGLWEPEFAVDLTGKLQCFFSDETQPGHSQVRLNVI